MSVGKHEAKKSSTTWVVFLMDSEVVTFFSQAALAEVKAPSLAEQFAEADRLYREAEQAVTAALAEIAACTRAHRAAGAKWAALLQLKNERERWRAELSERLRKESQQ